MNTDKYAHLRGAKTPPDAMDARHVRMTNAVLRLERPKSIVEIGCARGYSTSAILEAVLECGAIQTVDLCDPHLHVDLVNAVLACKPTHVSATFKVHPMPSRHYEGKPECWLIDGDHDAEALIDYDKAKAAGARIITVHDSNSAVVLGNHKGSLLIGERLKSEAVWYFEDKKKRPGEMTDRGMIYGFFYQPSEETKKALEALAQ